MGRTAAPRSGSQNELRRIPIGGTWASESSRKKCICKMLQSPIPQRAASEQPNHYYNCTSLHRATGCDRWVRRWTLVLGSG
jgi:hypothetical protein